MILFSINEENKRLKDRPEEIIKGAIYQDIGIKAVDSLKIYNFSEDKVVMFRYNFQDKNYGGFCQLNNSNEIIEKVLYEEIQEELFSFNFFSGKIEGTGENYLIIGGKVYSPNIKSIGITFQDNTLVNLIIGDEGIYSYISNREDNEIKKIEAFDEEYKIYKSKNIK